MSSDKVFGPNASVTIKAPPEIIWEILLDFSKYPEWNPFVRSQILLDDNGTIAADQSPRPGAVIDVKVTIPPSLTAKESSLQGSKQKITVVEKDKFNIEWAFVSPTPFLLKTHRYQWLRAEISSDGEPSTVYETEDAFFGPVAYIVKWTLGKGLQQGFDAMGEALKKRSEEVYQSRN
jgi:hypothetical protein